MSTNFKSGLYSTVSNSTIVNKNKQTSPNPFTPQKIVWLIWPNQKFQIFLWLRVKTLLITNSTYLNSNKAN